MYQIPKVQISFRVTPEEREILNQVSNQLQEEQGIEFTNANQLVFALITKLKTTETILNSLENNLNTDEIKTNTAEFNAENNTDTVENNIEFKPETNVNTAEINEFKNSSELLELIEQAKMTIGYDPEDSPATPEAVLRDLIEIINQPIETPKAIEKEVAVEVERKLSPNEILVNLTTQQVDVLELIARWRFSKRLDQEKKTKAEIIKAMTFNEATLLNYGDCYKTGIKSKNIK